MSRNLGQTDCRLCTCPVKITGLPMVYELPNCDGESIVFAHAECVACKAQYSAWLHSHTDQGRTRHRTDPTGTFYDLSFRSTFNDEPGRDDVPHEPDYPYANKIVEVFKVVRINGVQVYEEALS